MLLLSAGTRKTSRCALLKAALCLLLFLIAGSLCGSVQAQKINTVIRVCVKDEADQKVTEKLSIVLFNAPDKISSRKPDEEGCFKSAKITLELSETYLLAAQKDDRIQVSKLKLTPDDNNKVITARLKLAGLDDRTLDQPNIEICAEDENKKQLPVKSLAPSGDSLDVTKEKASHTDCARVKLGAANEYQLTLTTQSQLAASSAGGVSWLPVVSTLSFLVIISILLLTLGTFVALKRIERAKEVSPEAETIKDIFDQVQSLSQDVVMIKNKVEGWPKDGSPTDVPIDEPDDGERGTPEAEEITEAESLVPAAEIDGSSSQPPAVPPLTPASQANDRVAEVRQKYSDFISGAQVDHFCLMPLGSSSASQMVEDENITLREQDHGTYIAFCPNSDAAEAWVFPFPGYHFTSETFSAVFPNLTAQEYESGNVEPRRAVSIQPKSWKIE